MLEGMSAAAEKSHAMLKGLHDADVSIHYMLVLATIDTYPDDAYAMGVAKQLNWSAQAVRHHILQLEKDKMIKVCRKKREKTPGTRGSARKFYVLTAKGEKLCAEVMKK